MKVVRYEKVVENPGGDIWELDPADYHLMHMLSCRRERVEIE